MADFDMSSDQVAAHIKRLTDYLREISEGKAPSELEPLEKHNPFAPIYEGINALTAKAGREKSTSNKLVDQSIALEEAQQVARLGYWVYNFRDKTLLCSSELYKLLDIREQETVTLERLISMSHPDHQDVFKEHINKACFEGKDFEFEYPVCTANEVLKHFHCKGACKLDDRGKPVKLISVCHDITEEKYAEETLHEMNQLLEKKVAERTRELENSNSELESFAYVVSHDLKAPLRAIGSISDWIVHDFSDKIGPEGVKQLKLLKNRVNRMNNMIHGILDYSKITKVKEDELQDIDVGVVAREVFEMVNYEKNGNLILEKELPRIRYNRLYLSQIFENLMSNALKHNIKNEKEVYVGWNKIPLGAIFYVADNGTGIDEAYHKRIFQLFQTLTPRDQVESTGIGLTIVKKILDKTGGAIRVENIPDGGARFSFSIPVDIIEPVNNE